MKEKILAQLKAKFAGVQNVLLGLIADKMATIVTEESAIEQAVADLEKSPFSITEIGKLLQTEGDKRATEAATTRENTLKEKFNLVEKSADPGKDEPGKSGSDATLKAIQELKQELTDLKNEKAHGTLRNQVIEALKAKAVPENFFKKIIESKQITKEEEINPLVDDVFNTYKAFEQDMVDQGFSKVQKPLGNPNKEGVSDMVATFVSLKDGTNKANDLGGKQL